MSTSFVDDDGVTRFRGRIVGGGGGGSVIGPVSVAFDDAGIDTGVETALVVPTSRIAGLAVFFTQYWDPGPGSLFVAVGPAGGTFGVDTQDVGTYDTFGGNEGTANATLEPPNQSGVGGVAHVAFLPYRFRTKTVCAVFVRAVPDPGNPYTAGSADLYAFTTAL